MEKLNEEILQKRPTQFLRDVVRESNSKKWGREEDSNGMESYQVLKAICYILGKPSSWDYLRLIYNFHEFFVPPPPRHRQKHVGHSQ